MCFCFIYLNNIQLSAIQKQCYKCAYYIIIITLLSANVGSSRTIVSLFRPRDISRYLETIPYWRNIEGHRKYPRTIYCWIRHCEPLASIALANLTTLPCKAEKKSDRERSEASLSPLSPFSGKNVSLNIKLFILRSIASLALYSGCE